MLGPGHVLVKAQLHVTMALNSPVKLNHWAHSPDFAPNKSWLFQRIKSGDRSQLRTFANYVQAPMAISKERVPEELGKLPRNWSKAVTSSGVCLEEGPHPRGCTITHVFINDCPHYLPTTHLFAVIIPTALGGPDSCLIHQAPPRESQGSKAEKSRYCSALWATAPFAVAWFQTLHHSGCPICASGFQEACLKWYGGWNSPLPAQPEPGEKACVVSFSPEETNHGPTTAGWSREALTFEKCCQH